jgi:glycosyltransferase involved in cell wall biosynthesis
VPAPARAAVVPNFVAPSGAAVPTGPERDLVTVGGLEVAKNHRYLLEVLAEAKRKGRRYSLDVFGEGPQRPALVRQAQDLGIDDQVRFMGFRQDVRAVLPSYRAYVHTSLRESQGIALIEAMAAGLPLVVAARGGVSEVCDERSGARFWPLDDAAGAAAILVSLMDDDTALERASGAVLAAFRDRFDAASVAPRLCEFLLEEAPAGPTSASPLSALRSRPARAPRAQLVR